MKAIAILSLALVACGGSSLTQDDLTIAGDTQTQVTSESASSLDCALTVAKAVCEARAICNVTPNECAKSEGATMRGLTCTCSLELLAICTQETKALRCSADGLGACAACFQ